MAKNRGKKPAPSISQVSPQWRRWMPALGAGYGVVSLIPSNALCPNWPSSWTLIVIFGTPTLFSALELIRLIVTAHINRDSLVESRMAKQIREDRSNQASQQALLAMLAAAVAGVESNRALQRGRDSGIRARPVAGKPRPRRPRTSRQHRSGLSKDSPSSPSGRDP
jgi:hypothetical protein